MDKLTQVSLKTFELFGFSITLDPMVFYMTWLVMGLIIFCSILLTRRLTFIPAPIQGLLEAVFEFLEEKLTTQKLSLNDHVRCRINQNGDIRQVQGFELSTSKKYAVVYSPFKEAPELEIITEIRK